MSIWSTYEENSAFLKLPASDVIRLCHDYVVRLHKSADDNTHKKAVEVSEENARKNQAWYRFRKLETDVATIEESLKGSTGEFWNEHYMVKDVYGNSYHSYMLGMGLNITNAVTSLVNSISKDWKLIVPPEQEVIVSAKLVSIMRG